MSAMFQKETFRPLFDMIVVGKVLKLGGHHYETFPQTIFASGRERCCASGLAAHRERTNLSDPARAPHRRLSAWRNHRHHSTIDRSLVVGSVRSAVRRREPARCE